MDLSLTPDVYIPSVDDAGNYIDEIPIIIHGMFCPCGSRKDKEYTTTAKFSAHTKSQAHQNWLSSLNQNKANHYAMMIKNKKIVKDQRKIISELECHLREQRQNIATLIAQLTKSNAPIGDLLDIN